VERLNRLRRLHQAEPEPEVDEDEPLDLEPLQFERLNVEMHQAQPLPEAAEEDEVEDDMEDFWNPFEGQ
jgi:hypothetical protein